PGRQIGAFLLDCRAELQARRIARLERSDTSRTLRGVDELPLLVQHRGELVPGTRERGRALERLTEERLRAFGVTRLPGCPCKQLQRTRVPGHAVEHASTQRGAIGKTAALDQGGRLHPQI